MAMILKYWDASVRWRPHMNPAKRRLVARQLAKSAFPDIEDNDIAADGILGIATSDKHPSPEGLESFVSVLRRLVSVDGYDVNAAIVPSGWGCPRSGCPCGHLDLSGDVNTDACTTVEMLMEDGSILFIDHATATVSGLYRVLSPL